MSTAKSSRNRARSSSASLGLGREVLYFCAQVASSQPRKPLISCLLLLVHLQHPLRQEGQQIVHHIRLFLIGDEVASLVFGQAGLHLGQDFGELVLGVELLQLRSQAGALGRGGGGIDLKMNSLAQEMVRILDFSLSNVLWPA